MQYLPQNKPNNLIIHFTLIAIMEASRVLIVFREIKKYFTLKYLALPLYTSPSPIFCNTKNFVTSLSQRPTELSVLETEVTNWLQRVIGSIEIVVRVFF